MLPASGAKALHEAINAHNNLITKVHDDLERFKPETAALRHDLFELYASSDYRYSIEDTFKGKRNVTDQTDFPWLTHELDKIVGYQRLRNELLDLIEDNETAVQHLIERALQTCSLISWVKLTKGERERALEARAMVLRLDDDEYHLEIKARLDLLGEYNVKPPKASPSERMLPISELRPRKPSSTIPCVASELKEYASFNEAIPTLNKLIEVAEEQVRVSAHALYDKQIWRLLCRANIEELDGCWPDHTIESLKENGFNRVSSIRRADEWEVEHGGNVTNEQAKALKIAAVSFEAKARKTTHWTPFSKNDRRDPLTDNLILNLYKLIRAHSELCEYEATAKRIKERADQDVRTLNSLDLRFWPVISSSEREAFVKAYQGLGCLLRGIYPSSIKDIDRLELRSAQYHFEKSSSDFYALLDSIVPELLGPHSNGYGLPSGLIEEVGTEPVDLTGLRCALRCYQLWGVKYALHQKRCLLGDEMGLGKTVEAIAALTAARNSGGSRFVVVCPASVIANWERELRRRCDLPTQIAHGASKHISVQNWEASGGVIVMTYDGLALLSDNRQEIDYLIVDEAHYVKNPHTKRSQAVASLCRLSSRVLFLTGTALENQPSEMVSLIRMLQPDLAKRLDRLQSSYSAQKFREAAAPVYYRRKRDEMLDELPELIEITEWCRLGPEETAAYRDSVLNGSFSDVRRVSWTAPSPALSSKAVRLLELVEGARESGRKVLVFSFFLKTIDMVCELLGDRVGGVITGSTQPKARQSILDAFSKAKPGTVLVSQIEAGGVGLNAQSASVVILCEPQLKPSTESQAISRAYRMGQRSNVIVYRLLSLGTIDERLTSRLEEKQQTFDSFADKSSAAEALRSIESPTPEELMSSEKARFISIDCKKEHSYKELAEANGEAPRLDGPHGQMSFF